jgi:hypothetical protein
VAAQVQLCQTYHLRNSSQTRSRVSQSRRDLHNVSRCQLRSQVKWLQKSAHRELNHQPRAAPQQSRQIHTTQTNPQQGRGYSEVAASLKPQKLSAAQQQMQQQGAAAATPATGRQCKQALPSAKCPDPALSCCG